MNTHSSSPMTSTRILLVVGDALLRETLSDILREEGYELEHVSTLAQATARLDEEAFGLVLTELLDVRTGAPLHATSELVRKASPTPVGLVTGWNITNQDARNAGFAFFLLMPFELEELLAQVAGALRIDLTPAQEHQAEVARLYLAALSEGRLDDALAVCTETVLYHPPSTSVPTGGKIHDKASLRAYVLDALDRYPGARFENVNIYALPGRLAARFTLDWHATPQDKVSTSGSIVFRFEGEHIAEVGMDSTMARVALANLQSARSQVQAGGNVDGQQDMGAR